jgi:gamma-glutamyltranspeptidase/glutathione hydrolase/leukotriene-C4 hydrolase
MYAGESTGIIYNDQMDDFSTPGTVNAFKVPASPANFIKPGKKPMSSMSPIIVVDEYDDVRLVLGASGGTKIITAVAQVALENLFLDIDIKKSIDDKRIHHQLSPDFVQYEKGFEKVNNSFFLFDISNHKLLVGF